MTDVLVEAPADGVTLITLNRPESLNAMGGTLVGDLADALEDAERDRGVRCVAVTGAGKGFCSGGDVKGFAQSVGSGGGETASSEPREAPSPAVVLERSAARLYDSVSKTSLKLHTMLKPTVALVNGAAAGAGMSLALSCDIRLCSARARFVPAFGRIGFSGDYGGSYYLTKLVGYGRAREIYFTGTPVDAQRALELGIANHVFEAEELIEKGVEYCAKIAAGAPGAIARMKENFLRNEWAPIDQALREEAFNHSLSGTTRDFREGVRAFAEKREPSFTGE
jgi:2-(1,2-epoxy-1,2-dihydrophenyl)acetyl-CoA isomerase